MDELAIELGLGEKIEDSQRQPQPSARRKKQLLDSEKSVVEGVVEPESSTLASARVDEPRAGPSFERSVIEIDEESEVMKIPSSRPQSLKKSSVKKKKSSLSRKVSDVSKQKGRSGSTRQEHIPGFERLKEQKSIKMALDWVNFKIRDEIGEDLFHVAQTRNCSLTVTETNELFIRKPNAENVMRIHSNVAEDIRNFDFYAGSEKFIGTLACDSRQTFKVPAKLKNVLTGQTYSITLDREGEVKSWIIDETITGVPIARVEVQTGHRWKSLYTLTFIEPSSGPTSVSILCLGFLLALLSRRAQLKAQLEEAPAEKAPAEKVPMEKEI